MAHFKGCEWASVALPTFLIIAGTWAEGPDAFWNVSGSQHVEESEEGITNLRSLQRLLLGCNILCATQIPFAKQGE